MAFDIKKNERETNLSLVRRFSKRIKESGILRSAKKARFAQRPKSKTKRKAAALRRIEKTKEYDHKAKMGIEIAR